jgi:hypothetical protein
VFIDQVLEHEKSHISYAKIDLMKLSGLFVIKNTKIDTADIIMKPIWGAETTKSELRYHQVQGHTIPPPIFKVK